MYFAENAVYLKQAVFFFQSSQQIAYSLSVTMAYHFLQINIELGSFKEHCDNMGGRKVSFSCLWGLLSLTSFVLSYSKTIIDSYKRRSTFNVCLNPLNCNGNV